MIVVKRESNRTRLYDKMNIYDLLVLSIAVTLNDLPSMIESAICIEYKKATGSPFSLNIARVSVPFSDSDTSKHVNSYKDVKEK